MEDLNIHNNIILLLKKVDEMSISTPQKCKLLDISQRSFYNYKKLYLKDKKVTKN